MSIQELEALIAEQLPDNHNGSITPQNLRTVLNSIVDSIQTDSTKVFHYSVSPSDLSKDGEFQLNNDYITGDDSTQLLGVIEPTGKGVPVIVKKGRGYITLVFKNIGSGVDLWLLITEASAIVIE